MNRMGPTWNLKIISNVTKIKMLHSGDLILSVLTNIEKTTHIVFVFSEYS